MLAALGTSRLVDTIAAAASLPLDMRFPSVAVTPSGDSAIVDAIYNRVSASYFDVLSIGITSGRGFTRDDEPEGAAVIVSDATARRLWPNASPLGRSLHLRLRSTTSLGDPLRRYQDARVIGTVRDVVIQSVEDGKDQAVMYFPIGLDAPGCCLLARVRSDPVAAKRALDAELERAAPGGVDRIDRLETFAAGAIYPISRGVLGGVDARTIALALTVVGVYGVVAYVVGQRTREIGVRIALGATTRDVLRLMLGQSVRQAVTGGAIGALLALGVARVLASNIQGMPAFDVVAFVGASLCVIAACLGAALVPSRRASKIDPTAALRHD